MPLESLDVGWPMGSKLYNEMVLRAEVAKLERLFGQAWHQDAHHRHLLTVVHCPFLIDPPVPPTVASAWPPEGA